MRLLLWFSYFWVLLSCNSNKHTSDFELTQGRVVYLDSVKIDDESFSFMSAINPKVYNDTILGMGDGSFQGVHLFNAKTGEFIVSFESDSIETFQLPKKNYGNFSIQGDTVFILNSLNNTVYSFLFDKTFIDKTELMFLDVMQKSEYETLFEVNGSSVYTSSIYSGPLQDRFRYSKIVSVFNRSGVFQHDFGSYPKEYKEGNLVLSKDENKILTNDILIILNVAGVPKLKKYSLSGNLMSLDVLKSKNFDPQIGYFQGDPFSGPLTDQFNGLGSNVLMQDDIIYATFSSFDIRDRKEGLETYQWVLMKIDLKERTIKEHKIAGAWHLSEVRSLIPQVKGDTVSILIRNEDEGLYLKRLLFD
ncbi:hypothetical protein KIH41_01265 [Litoribacter ruber]|uniref:hypothetical protein n=1 Tax=Litoribacter ruber TaxID=702568 RepID=UPI001BDA1082|nr:hypothetical protein [Litoribacter ruber]MBT0809904.1 hypothetical protein [Litoribacter ruber]